MMNARVVAEWTSLGVPVVLEVNAQGTTVTEPLAKVPMKMTVCPVVVETAVSFCTKVDWSCVPAAFVSRSCKLMYDATVAVWHCG